MKTKDTVESAVKVDVAPFKLDIPAALDVKPTFVVQLSKARYAQIHTLPHTDPSKTGDAGYAARVVNLKGVTVDNYYCGSIFSHPHEVRQWLIDTSAHFNVKRKTRKTIMVEEADENDEE